jgi:hypothetical protein
MTWRGLAWPGLEGRELAWLSLAWDLPGVPCLAVPCIALLWRWRALAFIRQPTAMRCDGHCMLISAFSFELMRVVVLCTVLFALCLYYSVGTLIFLNLFSVQLCVT